MDARALYEQRLATHRAAAEQLTGRERTISVARLITIGAGLVLLFIQPLGGVVLILAFAGLAMAHEVAIRRRLRATSAARFYERGMERLTHAWAGKGVDGHEFADEHHPYSGDFDLFGKGSIYELLCIAATAAGRARLATWLREPCEQVHEIVARQEAVLELRGEVDLREEMAIVAAEVTKEVEHGRIEEWAAMPPLSFAPWERIAALTLGALAGLLFALVLPGILLDVVGFTDVQKAAMIGPLAVMPSWPLLVAIVAASLLARRMHRRVESVIAGVERAEPALALLSDLLRVLEKRTFVSPRLIELRARLERSGEPASRQIERLRRLVALLDARRNQFFMPFAALVLCTTTLAVSIERWRRGAGQEIAGWIAAVAEIEALSSFASLAFEQPSFAMPEIIGEGPLFDGRGLGHPLIPEDRRVTNDLRLADDRRLLVVSGSNMSGKSTMLRSVGVAAVLGLAGAPVCATSLRIAPLRVGASIRINDSLQEGASRFYAEILRLRQILELARGSRPLLFLLDEILAGTNSHDRRIGAEAVVRGLVERGAVGLVSTHDLALADIAESLAPRAANVHFEDHLEDGRVAFDYRMRPGVVTKSNALALMRAVGIEV